MQMLKYICQSHVTLNRTRRESGNPALPPTLNEALSYLFLRLHHRISTILSHLETATSCLTFFHHGSSSGYIVPLGGHVPDPAVHRKRDRQRCYQRSRRARRHGLSGCEFRIQDRALRL